MTDEEIQIIRGRRQVDPPSWTQLHHALADEVRRRGEEIARWKAAAQKSTPGQSGWARCFEYEREVTVLRERLARLEIALGIAASLIANAGDGRINWQADAVRWRHDYQDLVKPRAALESSAVPVVERPA